MLEGQEVEEINFEGSELENRVINKGTNTLIVKTFMEECIKDDDGVLPAKTIFFCMTKAHARRIEKILALFALSVDTINLSCTHSQYFLW